MTTYTTVSGDEWDYIAKKKMGSEKYMNLLIEANEKYRDILIIPADLELVIPDVPQNTSLINPPWKV